MEHLHIFNVTPQVCAKLDDHVLQNARNLQFETVMLFFTSGGCLYNF